ncbi:MAG: DUF2782 domain-containing protein [Xanthomonadales bacterium]|nr:DUF2782 domain-containing protein [Xanthomonadales bacterium]
MSASSHPRVALALFAALAFCSSLAIAQQEAPPPPPIPEVDTPPVQQPPPVDPNNEPLPPKIVDEELEPTVTIRREKEITYEEYRSDGRIYMIRVVPDGGIPYYLLDTDGDGDLETHSDDQRGQPVKPVYWKLKEW